MSDDPKSSPAPQPEQAPKPDQTAKPEPRHIDFSENASKSQAGSQGIHIPPVGSHQSDPFQAILHPPSESDSGSVSTQPVQSNQNNTASSSSE